MGSVMVGRDGAKYEPASAVKSAITSMSSFFKGSGQTASLQGP